MGKDWYWVNTSTSTRSSSSKKVADKETTAATASPSGCMSAVFHFFDFHHFQFPLNHHHHQSVKPNSNHLHLPHEENHHIVVKGAEAPRNSLELEEPPLLPSLNAEENLNIPMGIPIKKKGSNHGAVDARLLKPISTSFDSSSETISSPSAKTPNLVARLMGLDLLPPETGSPSSFHASANFTASKSTNFRPSRQSLYNSNFTAGTRSLPETPRISSARRSDVDHHRLSLQINKENEEHHEFSRFSDSRRRELKQEDEYRSLSPRNYAKQIVKQVKESVNRRVGVDITNNLTRNNRDEIIHQIKSKKLNYKSSNKSFDHHQTQPSCSPRLSRYLEPKQKQDAVARKPLSPVQVHNDVTDVQCQSQGAVRVRSKLQAVEEKEEKVEQVRRGQNPAAKRSKKEVSEKRFTSTGRMKKPPQTTDIIRNKQEEPFVRASTGNRVNHSDHKKCKKTPLSSELLSIAVPNLLSVKKDPSAPAIQLPQKPQVLNAQSSKHSSQLSSNSSQKCQQQTTTHNLIPRDNDVIVIPDVAAPSTTATSAATNAIPTVSTSAEEEYEYVTRILKRTGIDKNTPISVIRWFSPSHPLNPSIFQHVENVTIKSGQLRHQCNRKLLFHLVDELLEDLLKPFTNMKPWVNGKSSGSNAMDPRGLKSLDSSLLINTCCSIIKSYPRADCRVVEDIDALIDGDLPKINVTQNDIAFAEEGEAIVTELEKHILDSLIVETTSDFRMGAWW